MEIEYYEDYLSRELLEVLWERAEVVEGVEGLRVAPGLRSRFGDLETVEALRFVVEVYEAVRESLAGVLAQRRVDRAFIDRRTRSFVEANASRAFESPQYETVLGLRDEAGRLVVGPHAEEVELEPVEIPSYLQGEQVTLFGPPDSAKLAINAMNALHRKSPEEPAIVTELVESAGQRPRWGADNEDSKTPIMADLLEASRNLKACFEGTLRLEDSARGKVYELAEEGLAQPIKRVVGLALPDGSHLLRGEPLPLHLYDFAMHLFHNWSHPEALAFYVPKLENEEEAAYVAELVRQAEALIQARHPDYVLGSVRLMIVFENPRAIFRIREMARALHPYFLGGSLGWHDFLGSTARVFREDPRYRIPVKADPNIVINNIRESHHLLVEALSKSGAIKIGGMYGVLHEDGNPDSYVVSMVGYVKDVITQLKRGLDGFWVAHPDFVRPGLALVEAFRRWQRSEDPGVMRELLEVLVPQEQERRSLESFVFGDDIEGLPREDSLYLRGVLAADLEQSPVIANDDPRELRYNIFQALQYLADWLRGNGCVALPATMRDASGQEVFVRIMDDLATTERSRWELWAEVAHGRVSHEQFEQLLREEIDVIQRASEDDDRRVQVRWEGEAARWYPIAVQLLRLLVLRRDPVEFATEYLLPFTFAPIREADDPWEVAQSLCPGRYSLTPG